MSNSHRVMHREVVDKFPALRQTIIEKLIQTSGEIFSRKVFCGALWVVGEYCEWESGVQLLSLQYN